MEPLQNNEQNGIDIMEIVGTLLGHFWIIVFSGVLVGLCALFYTRLTATPTYTSSTKLYVLSQAESTSSGVTNSDLQLSATLAGDFAQLIKDRTVTESVISELGLEMSSDELASKITVEMPDSGRIITISVTDADPYMASKLVTAVRDTAALHIKEVMDLEAVNVVEEADIPQGQNMESYKRNGLMGAAAGIVIAAVIIVLRFMMNDTIRNADDVKRYLDTSVLGSIPMIQEESKKEKRARRKKGRRESK